MAKKGLIEAALGSSAAEQAQSKAGRLLKTATRTSRDYVEKLDKECDDIRSAMDEILEVSAGTDVNAGMRAITDEEMACRIKHYHELGAELHLKQGELNVAKLIHTRLITGEEE